MNTNTKLIFACAAALLSTSVASAQTNEPKTVAVRFGDLNLSSQKGQTVLANRIGRAAKNVCSGDTEAYSLAAKVDFGKCVEITKARAIIAFKNIQSAALAAR